MVINGKKVLVLFSGGLDSTVLLHMAIDRYGKENVGALSMYYGQKHMKEQECAELMCNLLDVPRYVKDLTDVFSFSKSSMLAAGGAMSHLSYAEQKETREGLDENGNINSYVPFRNGLFLSVASAIAYSLGYNTVAYGAHSDDAAGDAYPDCTIGFVAAMDRAISQGTGDAVSIWAPFALKTKGEIVADGINLKVPFENTWSCYEGGDVPCHTCATCVDREKAFILNGTVDPLV